MPGDLHENCIWDVFQIPLSYMLRDYCWRIFYGTKNQTLINAIKISSIRHLTDFLIRNTIYAVDLDDKQFIVELYQLIGREISWQVQIAWQWLDALRICTLVYVNTLFKMNYLRSLLYRHICIFVTRSTYVIFVDVLWQSI